MGWNVSSFHVSLCLPKGPASPASWCEVTDELVPLLAQAEDNVDLQQPEARWQVALALSPKIPVALALSHWSMVPTGP